MCFDCEAEELRTKLEAAQKEIKCLVEVHQVVEKIAFELYEKQGVESSDAAIKMMEKLKPVWGKYGVLKPAGGAE